MSNQSGQIPWDEPGWLDEAGAWIRSALDRQGIAITRAIEQPHVRAWSTVLTVPTAGGTIYFKASAPVLGHEPGLTEKLARWRPDCMPEVLATDLQRRWMLMADAGSPLRTLVKQDRDIRRWHTILPMYAELQMEMAGRLDELLALGVLDRRLALLPEKYARIIDDTEALLIDQPDGLTSDEHRRLHELAPRFAAMCEQVAGYGIPQTLHHDDFHDGNIFVRDGRFILTDWGESCASHPFFTLVVTLRSIGHTLGLEQDHPDLLRLRDIYLEPWTRYVSRAELLSAFRLAHEVGMLNRALTWHEVVSHLDEPYRSQYAGAVPGWVQEFLNAVTSDVGR